MTDLFKKKLIKKYASTSQVPKIGIKTTELSPIYGYYLHNVKLTAITKDN